MPYSIVKNSAQCPDSKPHAVVAKESGKPVPGGCHATVGDAQKHLAALNANVPEASDDRALTEGGSGGYVLKPHYSGCPSHKPHGVVGADGKKAGCHATTHSAAKHAAALNAGVPEAKSGTVPGAARMVNGAWSADCPACGARMGVRLSEATQCGCGVSWRPLVLDSARGMARLEIVP